jgi:hopanoid biosynthesis associated RND transporter like protein HpnN
VSTARSRTSELIAAFVTRVTRWPLITVLVMFALTGASLYYAAGHLGINTDTANMISPELPWRMDFNEYRASFPVRDQNIVAVVDSTDGELSMSFARDLARALHAEPNLFPTVFLQGDGDFFERNGLLYLPLEDLQVLADRLIEAQPLLGRLAQDVSGAGVVDTLAMAIERSDELSPANADDLDRILVELGSTLAAANDGDRRPIIWGRLIGFDPQTSSRRLILIRPTLDFTRARPARDAIERIRALGDEINRTYGGAVTLRLTGTLAMEHEELTSITRSATAAGLAALATVIIVLLWALRSLKLLAIAIATLLSGLALTAAFAAAIACADCEPRLHGHLNLLSVAFAVLYVGLGVDFILHLCLRVKELRRARHELVPALIETARGVGTSLIICAVTTAIGFFAFIPTDFDGISELGLISGSGMLISLAVSLTLVPALITLFWSGDDLAGVAERPRTSRFRLKTWPPKVTCTVAAIVMLGSMLLVPKLRFDGNPIHLRDPAAESIVALNELAMDSDAPVFDLAVLVPNAMAAQQVASALAGVPTVARVITAASLVPSDQDDKLLELEYVDLVLGATLLDFATATPDAGRIRAALERLVRVLDGQSRSTVAGGAVVNQARAWLAADASATNLDTDILGNLVDQMRRLSRALEAAPVTLADLPPELEERWINDAGQQLVEVVPRDDLNDNEAARRFVADVRAVAPHATGLPVVYQEAAATVTTAFVDALTYAFIVVTLLLLLFLRSLADTLLILVPIAFAAVVTSGASVALGLPLNFANIIALPLLVGVGVDSGIHMVHRMRTEPPKDGDPLHTSTSRAVFASALTTIASFGNLAFASHLGMASMGQLLTLGMVTSLIAVLGLLPALMRLLGRTA